MKTATAVGVAALVLMGPITAFFAAQATRAALRGAWPMAVGYVLANIAIVASIPVATALIAARI